MRLYLVFQVLLIFPSLQPQIDATGPPKYLIQNSGDHSFLASGSINDAPCTPLSEVKTEEFQQQWGFAHPVSHKWTLESSSVKNSSIFHLKNGKVRNEITFNKNFPPYCYTIYNNWNIERKDGEVVLYKPILIKNEETGQCISSNGVDNRIGYTRCDSTSKTQLWIFSSVS